ncbi:hypothetical protein H0H92_008919 [Tricholoma furcatifolium]|nr:hypothetical protein H0H92_008919 [Tricholoma furcatifolium]
MDTEKSLTTDPSPPKPSLKERVTNFLLHWGVETQGISPTSVQQRVDKRLYQMFFIWLSANMNVLALSTGSAGSAFFKLGLAPTAVVVIIVDVVTCAIPAFLYESVAWIPNVIAFIVMLGVGGKDLKISDYPAYPPPSAPRVLSYITFVASTVISWCTMTPDYGVYHDANASSFMAISPIFARVPQYVFAIISEAILIPVGIIGAKRFYGTLVNVLSIIGYWSTAFSAIVIVEHLIFRGCDFKRYLVEDWNKPKKLPLGVAALLAFSGAIGIIIPSMSQDWFVGPIAKSTGDIGVPVGFVAAGCLYALLRYLELWLTNIK